MRFSLPFIALAAISTPIAAQADTTVPVRVTFADIDVTSSAGRSTLEARVEAKLIEACTIEENSRYTYGRSIVDQKCVSDGRTQAMEAIAKVAANQERVSRQASAN